MHNIHTIGTYIPLYDDNVLLTFVFFYSVISSYTDIQLDLKFIDGSVNITATWMVSGN